jgi:hypothetical protein
MDISDACCRPIGSILSGHRPIRAEDCQCYLAELRACHRNQHTFLTEDDDLSRRARPVLRARRIPDPPGGLPRSRGPITRTPSYT